MPAPIANEDSDLWFVWQPFFATAGTSSASQSDGWRLFPFDSKAQRKVEEGDDIAVMLENAHATAGLEYILKFRMLVKLH